MHPDSITSGPSARALRRLRNPAAKTFWPEHAAWTSMRQRCENPNHPRYPLYGARGIFVCDRWQSFDQFYADMGPCPPKHSIERDDNDGPYSPENCRWATQREQLRNRRNNHRITFLGRTQTLTDWAEELGQKYQTLQKRIKRGWPLERVLTPGSQRPGQDPRTGQFLGRQR